MEPNCSENRFNHFHNLDYESCWLCFEHLTFPGTKTTGSSILDIWSAPRKKSGGTLDISISKRAESSNMSAFDHNEDLSSDEASLTTEDEKDNPFMDIIQRLSS